jgi:RecA-family ATPase
MIALRLTRASELKPQAVSWLWPGRLALGSRSLLSGDPGLGKTFLALDWCARLSSGRPMPDGSPNPGPANAIVLSGEDDPKQTIRPRLEALGADLDRVFIPSPSDDFVDGPCLPSQWKQLDEAVAARDARLLVIDPITEFLDAGISLNSDVAARRALRPLKRLATRHQCAVLVLRHLNKSGRGPSIYRGGGSIGLLGACRSDWVVGRDPTQPDISVLAQVKNNLGPRQPSLAYRFEGGDGAPPNLVWLGTSSLQADQLVGPAGGGVKEKAGERARRVLKEMLEHGPRVSREIWKRMAEEDLPIITVRRAKDALEVQVKRVYENRRPVSYWLLKGQSLPESARGKEFDLGAFLGQPPPAPPPSPLDDWE